MPGTSGMPYISLTSTLPVKPMYCVLQYMPICCTAAMTVSSHPKWQITHSLESTVVCNSLRQWEGSEDGRDCRMQLKQTGSCMAIISILFCSNTKEYSLVLLGSHSVTNSISSVTASSSLVPADRSPVLTDASPYSIDHITYIHTFST